MTGRYNKLKRKKKDQPLRFEIKRVWNFDRVENSVVVGLKKMKNWMSRIGVETHIKLLKKTLGNSGTLGFLV